MTTDAPAAAAAYSVHVGDAVRDREQVLAIWRGNLGHAERLEAKYDWYYLDCPYGKPLLVLLRHEASQAWVGIAAAGPRRMRWQGREIRAGVLVDLAVGAEHRTLGPALMLQRALLTMAEEHFELVYGMPNPKALPVFSRLGCRRAGDLVRYVRVVRSAPYLARTLPKPLAHALGTLADGCTRLRERLLGGRRQRLLASWHDRVDPRMEALRQAVPPVHALHGIHDTELLEWRLDRLPGRNIRHLLLCAADDGRPLAWFACEAEQGLLHVRDFCSAPATLRDGLAGLAHAARMAGHAAVSIEHAGSFASPDDWHAAGFVERGRRPVIARGVAMDATETKLLGHFTGADEDE